MKSPLIVDSASSWFVICPSEHQCSEKPASQRRQEGNVMQRLWNKQQSHTTSKYITICHYFEVMWVHRWNVKNDELHRRTKTCLVDGLWRRCWVGTLSESLHGCVGCLCHGLWREMKGGTVRLCEVWDASTIRSDLLLKDVQTQWDTMSVFEPDQPRNIKKLICE